MTFTELRKDWWKMHGHYEIKYTTLNVPTHLVMDNCQLAVARELDLPVDFAWVLVRNYGAEVVQPFNHCPNLRELMEVNIK